jgi:hypothetical protein
MSDSVPDEYAHRMGFDMDEAAVDAFLRERGHGVLSLADGSEAYGIPISFGYDGERLFFVFQRPTEESRKEQFAGTTETATLTAYDVGGKHDWRSVVVSGPIRRIDEGEWPALLDAIEGNAWYPSLFSQAEPMQDFLGYELLAESATGLAGTSGR